jgi:flagellar hook-basal body complex protein FliE
MNISQLQRFRQASIGGTDDTRALPQPRMPGGPGGGFTDTLRDAVDQVNASQQAADEQVEAFIAGEQENVHEVVIAMNQAKLHFQLMTEVRNRMLESYQELSRMQV